MEVRITTLSENAVLGRPRGLLGEWGLSILVERDDRKIPLDTGSSISAARNGALLGVNWDRIDAIVLSHGHYDHTGGLREVLTRIKKQVQVIAHPDVFDAKFVQISKDESPAYIGIPFQKTELETLGASFHLTSEPVWLSENVVTSGEIPMITDFEAIDPGLYVRESGEMIPDPLRDDQALFIKTSQGLVVILGCAHRGTINTLHHARNVTGVETIHSVIGGTHLIRASEVQMELTVAALKELGVQMLAVSHCTGMLAAMRLAQEFGPGFLFNNSGSIIEI
jgi:7,8-dihydropterin-6-yl-methyl-4-(beta-D-ribofuranosyl)aminobenzene 5'-phosphate synthase